MTNVACGLSASEAGDQLQPICSYFYVPRLSRQPGPSSPEFITAVYVVCVCVCVFVE